MFIPLPGPPHERCARRPILLRCAALIAVLTWLLILSACSGFSVPAASGSTPPPATNSTAALTISNTLPSGTVGAAYSAALSVSGGTAPYLFSLASGQLPTSMCSTQTREPSPGHRAPPGPSVLPFQLQIPRAYQNSKPCKLRSRTLRFQTQETPSLICSKARAGENTGRVRQVSSIARPRLVTASPTL